MTHSISFQHLQALGESIRVCDSEVVDGDHVCLYHYTNCNDESSDELKQFRGVVFVNDKLVMRGFPYTPEHIVSSPDTTVATSVFANSRFFDSFEGTIIRVFYHKKWFVSTHKRLDASKSHWASSESFEEIFRRGIDKIGARTGKFNYETFFETLDKTRQYMFLVRNTSDNRIVSYPPNDNMPPVFHVGTYIGGIFNIDEDIGVPRPHEHTFENPEQLIRHVSMLNPLWCQGVFVMGPTGFHKFVNGMYHFYAGIRGNEPNLVKRYLDLRMNPEQLQVFLQLYDSPAFNRVELSLQKIARNIHTVYMKRFISKQYAVVDPTRYGVLKKCHSLYLQNRQPVTLEVVWSVLNKESPNSLYHMILC
jgi:hypothetical protein